MIKTSTVLDRIRPNSVWALKADDLSTIRWIEDDKDGKGLPTEKEVEDTRAIMQVEHDAQEYARNRKTEYPDTGTQFNKIYDDGVTKWKSEMIDPVKTKWPKDNSGPV